MEWKDLKKAKAALQRIKEHYTWYEAEQRYSRRWDKEDSVPEPEWHKGSKYEQCLSVELDNGNFVEFWAPWCGYFERLYSAKIIIVEPDENDMEISF